MINERRAWAMDGFAALFMALVSLGFSIFFLAQVVTAIDDANRLGSRSEFPGDALATAVGLFVLFIFLAQPLVIIQPGEARVVQFFGRYIGTARRTGLTWVLPLTTRKRVSIRVNNFETNELKVNDAAGNPVNIAAIVVWQVADTARATFAVEDYRHFVTVQAEAALRHVATTHPYDDYTGRATSLRGSTDIVSGELAHEVAERVTVAGIEIVECRISQLAYAQEIAQSMLQRQQAAAVVAAREQIVDGAVTMVEQALNRLEADGVLPVDGEHRARMVSSLLVVLCGDQTATPVINTGGG